MVALVNFITCVNIIVCTLEPSLAATAVRKLKFSDHEAVPLPMSMKLDNDSDQQLQQFCFNLKSLDTHIAGLACSENGASLAFGDCVTYDKGGRIMSFSSCLNLQSNSYNVTTTGRIQLPGNLTQLDDYMCGPLNRTGIACSECADGFGPSVTSFRSKCVTCTDTWYGVPLFLFLELVPITVFYLIILVLQISFATPPMPCLIMYAQFIVASFYLIVYGFSDSSSIKDVLLKGSGNFRLDMKIVAMLYGVLNLDFFQLALPPLCINRQIKFIHITSFGYISALYPILLISLTWVAIELHGRNFRPFVWLWRPFHRCFVRLRRCWNTKSDIIDVFITFFLLSYSKCMYQTLLLLTAQGIFNYTETGKFINVQHRIVIDLTTTYGSTDHLVVLVPAVMIFFILNIMPPLLLMLYPIKAFKLCLSKCRLDFIAVDVFVDKLQGCYRNGLDKGRDMRSFSGLYFLLRMVIYLTGMLSQKILSPHRSQLLATVIWFPAGTIFFILALTIALIKPYKAVHMNYLDILLLSNLSLMCYLIAARLPYMLHTVRILLLSPIAALLLKISYKFKLLNIKTWYCRLVKNIKC